MAVDAIRGLPAEPARSAIALLVAVMAVLFTFWPQLDARLDLRQDDHRIIFAGSDRPLHHQVREMPGAQGPGLGPSLLPALRTDILRGGRFRPLTVALEVYLPRLIGTEAHRWHVLGLVLAAICTTILFGAGLALFGTASSALAFAMMVMLAPDPGPARTWYMMSTKAEAVGTLLIALAVFLMTAAATSSGTRRRLGWDIAALGAATMAALAKESFVLLLPALAALRLFLQTRGSRLPVGTAARDIAGVLAGHLALGLALLAACLWAPISAGGGSYGHAFTSPVPGLVRTAAHLPSQAVWFVPSLLAAAALRTRGTRASLLRVWPNVAIAALWVVPQIGLYAVRGGMWDHYWLPGVMGMAGLNGAALQLLRALPAKALHGLAFTAVALWAANGVRVNHMAVENFATRTAVLQQALANVVEHTPAAGRLLIVGDGGEFSEYAFSWLFFLGHAGRQDVKVYLYDTRRGHRGKFSRTLFFPYASTLAQVRSCDVDAVVFLSQPASDDTEWYRWFDGRCQRTVLILGPQRFLSLSQLGWTRSEFGIAVSHRSQMH